MTKVKWITAALILFSIASVAVLYAAWPSFDRIPIKVQSASGAGSNSSMISFVEYGADYMRDVASSTETGNYLAGQYHDSIFGFFTLDWSSFVSDNVRIGSTVSDCATGTGYKLTGNAYSEIFGFVEFDYNNDIYVYYCPSDDSLYGHAYGEWVGFQNFTGIKLESGPVPVAGGLKVLGQTHNEQFNEIRAGQNENDLHILGSTDKSLQLSNIKRRVLSFARSIPDAGTGLKQIRDMSDFNDSSNRGGQVFESGNIIYFKGNASEFVTLGNGTAGSTLTVHWKKTIIVAGGDLYIKSNITYGNKDSDILGIIVLQDSDGKGGNIIVHPSVTNLAGTLVAEKVLLSWIEISGNLEIHNGSTDEAVLANQLHIFGNLFSENTIGGAVGTNPQCPYYVKDSDCTTVSQAQSFDLNFLRRFKLDSYGNPAHGGMVAGGGACSAWSCTGWNSDLMKNILSTSDPLIDYPLVIEYNPKIQLMPPPLLSSQ